LIRPSWLSLKQATMWPQSHRLCGPMPMASDKAVLLKAE